MKSASMRLCLAFVSLLILNAQCGTSGPGALIVAKYTVKVAIDGQGTVVRTTDKGDVPFTDDVFSEGGTLTLTATPAQGWRFDHWEGITAGSTQNVTVTVQNDMNLKVVFVRQYALSVDARGEGTVSVGSESPAPSFDGVSDTGSQITITATAAVGWIFHRWEGSSSSTQSVLTITMDGDKNLTAVFLSISGTRAVTIGGTRLGRVTVAMKDGVIKGVRRTGDFGADLNGTIIGNQISLTSTAPGYQDAYISASVQADGAWTGTITGSGYANDSFSASPSDFTGFDTNLAGLHSTTLDGDVGQWALVEKAGAVKGTWRLAYSLGGDVEGVVQNGQITLTVTIPGYNPCTVTGTVLSTGGCVGYVNGSGYVNAPFSATAQFFP